MVKDKITLADLVPTLVWVFILCVMAIYAVMLSKMILMMSLMILLPLHLFFWLKNNDRRKHGIIMGIYLGLLAILFMYNVYIDHYAAKIRADIISFVEDYRAKYQHYPSSEIFKVHYPRSYGSWYQMLFLTYTVDKKNDVYHIFYTEGTIIDWDYFSASKKWQTEAR